MAIDIVAKEASKVEIMEKVLVQGDLSKLSPAERMSYYMAVCESVGLNPLTRPLEYITLNNKLTLYARKDATDQLRKLNGVSVTDLDAQQVGDVQMVVAKGRDAQGRTDASTGAVSIAGLRGDALANALMKAETKAKRRLTLSLCGLGILDETEIETTPAETTETRTIMQEPKVEPKQQSKSKRPADQLEVLQEIAELVKSWPDGRLKALHDEVAKLNTVEALAAVKGRIVSEMDAAILGANTELDAAAEAGFEGKPA